VVGFDVDPDTVEHVVGDGNYHVAEGGVTFCSTPATTCGCAASSDNDAKRIEYGRR